MATETRKVLGQTDMPVSLLQLVYTVPAATQAVVSTIYVCNLSASPTSFRISIAIAGGVDIPNQYIYYDVAIPGNETFASTTGVTMGPLDELRAYTPGSNISISVFGVEIT